VTCLGRPLGRRRASEFVFHRFRAAQPHPANRSNALRLLTAMTRSEWIRSTYRRLLSRSGSGAGRRLRRRRPLWRTFWPMRPEGARWVGIVRQALVRLNSPRVTEASSPAAKVRWRPSRRAGMIRGMVGRLAPRLHQDGSDVDGWLPLVWRHCGARIVCRRTRLLEIERRGQAPEREAAVGRAGRSLH
jgi:hypothetical protein